MHLICVVWFYLQFDGNVVVTYLEAKNSKKTQQKPIRINEEKSKKVKHYLHLEDYLD